MFAIARIDNYFSNAALIFAIGKESFANDTNKDVINHFQKTKGLWELL